eukprot:Nitzschia sp. Nitz4//scaffold126_size65214//52417//54267//NITZ4_006164-RA/size65214-exonerate_est2genome-gene-0.12-mRNA-1//-1//CDS//3329534713//2171//frame0
MILGEVIKLGELSGNLGDALSIKLGSLQVPSRNSIGSGIRSTLDQASNRGSHVVDITSGVGSGVGRQVPQTDPNSSVLRSQCLHINQRNLLVTIQTGGTRKSAENLILPALSEPNLGGGVGELLELPSRSSHVSRGSEDDGIGLGKSLPVGLSDFSFGTNGYFFGVRTLYYRFSDNFVVAIAREVNDGNRDHV